MLLRFISASGLIIALAPHIGAVVIGSEVEVQQQSGQARPRHAEVRDLMMMLDDGPLHMRLYVTLGGISLETARSNYVARLIKSLDTNGDDILSHKEADRSPLLTTRRRAPGAAEFLESLGKKQTVSRSEIMRAVERVGGETVVYRQDDSAASNDREVFDFLDVDGSGVIDRTEMAAARERIREKDEDRDECVSLREFLPPREQPQEGPLVVINPGSRQRRPIGRPADLLRDSKEPLLPRRLVRRYDDDKDGHLSAAELGWSRKRVASLDKDGNRKLDSEELAAVVRTPPDLEIAVELARSESGQPTLKLLSATGRRDSRTERPGFARVVCGTAVLTLSCREVDPVPAAIANAMKKFNQLDTDANGYLEEQETDQELIFKRGLFQSIDSDGDGKIFGEEMEYYVSMRGEPTATSCRANVYDMGYGFFHTLDRNGDGRISMREMRAAEQTLRSFDRDQSEGLSPDEPARHFHIEFVRGSYQLFGRVERMFAQAPAFEQISHVGPIWFRRMDRNSDGDLTWNEFLGPREVFNRLDRDRDGLLDHLEAQKAEEK